MINRYCCSFILFSFLSVTALAQTPKPESGLRGTIKTTRGEPLPYAAILVRGTNIGTISNEEGKYLLDLKPGYYEIIFQYLGFKNGTKAFTIENKIETFDPVLEEQVFILGEVRIGSKDEDPAYTIMRRAIAKSRYHFLQVESYTAKAYSKSSFVVTDLPLEFLYKKELKELEKESNFKKGVPILNESVSIVNFTQPNNYKQRIIASRNSQDQNFSNANAYFLTSFYKPEVVEAVSPLSPRAFSYYKFEYLGSFRENGVEVNKIKVIPRSYGEGVYRGTIQIVENEWSIYRLELETVNTGFNIGIKQIYSQVQGVWMPVNQQFHVGGGIYGLKGKGDLVISQTFSSLKVNPAFQPDIVVLDAKKEKDEARQMSLTKREIKTQNLDELISKQKKFTARDLRKMMKEHEKKELQEKEEKGLDIDLENTRKDSTFVDSLAGMRTTAFWDSIRSVPLTKAETKSYSRLDSLIIIKEGPKAQRDSLKTAKTDSTKNNNGKKGKSGSFGDILTGHTFRLGDKKSPWRLEYVSPLIGAQVNTTEGWVLDGGGLKLKYNRGKTGENKQVIQAGTDGVKAYTVRQKSELSFNGLTRYSFGRNKLMGQGGVDYAWKRNTLSFSGGQTVTQFNPNSPMSPILNSLTTLFLEQNFLKNYEKNFLRLNFAKQRENDHFGFNAELEYADRRSLSNLEKLKPYCWIDWKNKAFTSNIPFNEELLDDSGTRSVEMPNHQAVTLGVSAFYKPWQKYRTRKGVTVYYEDQSPKFFVNYRKGIGAFGSDVDFDILQAGVSHGFDTGIRSRLNYKLAAGGYLNNKAVYFPDFQHFPGNQFFFQYGDPIGTFRVLDYYRFSTAQRFVEAHALTEMRQFLLTQIQWFRVLGIKENLIVHYLATPSSNNYTELGYGLDIGIRFPIRVEILGSFQDFKYQRMAFIVGLTRNFSFGK
ncbi:DUF5686 and carboxypeptidase regulatory-like domain-containing protein [Persicitalea sp.]|uniref:DUF5686 and carboxypeptidase regulatory-like domain-containing protein n=1 Tax=Persicitalea sp. TaxID=3100273 RepID=UPI003592F61A